VNKNVNRARIQEGRTKNAVAKLLDQRLIAPKIFFDAAWPSSSSHVDLLAVDRAGAGDIHVVEVDQAARQREAVTRAFHQSAHYKYAALIGSDPFFLPEQDLYSEDGLGRVGIIRISQTDKGNLVAQVEIVPERFRVKPEIIKRIDQFTAREQADIEVRS